MKSIFKYCFFDLLRSRWGIIYTIFFLLTTSGLLYFSGSPENALASLTNVVTFVCPLVSILMGVIYFYQNRDFAELILSQPIKRSSFFLGNYFGLSLSLILSFLLGIGIPFLTFGSNVKVISFLSLSGAGVLLTLIFSALALLVSTLNENRLKGFGISILIWLVFAIIYDGIFLLALIWFNDYPLDVFALVATILNPIDLVRIIILLNLDLSTLLGFNGAAIREFLGSGLGVFILTFSGLFWVFIPLLLLLLKGKNKDF